MWLLGKTIKQLYANTANVPRVVEKRCIRLFHKKAQCTDCLDVCPEDAITIGRPGTSVLIRSNCTGCELCVAACKADTFLRRSGKESALVTHFVKFPNHSKNERVSISCRQNHKKNRDDILIPCIGSLHAASIIGILQESCKKLFLNFGNCDECKTGRGEKITNAVVTEAINILEQNKLTPFTWESTPTAIVCIPPFLTSKENQTVPDRREMLLHILNGARNLTDLTIGNKSREENVSFELKHKLTQKYLACWAIKEGLSPSSSSAFIAHIPPYTIDKQLCSGCGLCSVICRNGALVQKYSKEMPEYRRENCSKCGLCIFGCSRKAIRRSIGNTKFH